jgi:hypothetical protein
MYERMTGTQLRAHVQAAKPVKVAVSYGGWYWLVPWTNPEEILKLAELLTEREQEATHGAGDDSILWVEWVTESENDEAEPVLVIECQLI